jgi:hypothetical protein
VESEMEYEEGKLAEWATAVAAIAMEVWPVAA